MKTTYFQYFAYKFIVKYFIIKKRFFVFRHHKFDQLLEDRYYDENEVKQVVEKYILEGLQN